MSETKTVKSYKVDPEIRAKVEALFADSGLPSEGEFLGHLASLFEMQQMKEGSAAGYSKQISELEYHSRRTVELYLSMIQTEQAERSDLSQGFEEQLSELRNAYLDAQEQLQTLLRDSNQAWSEVKTLKTDLDESRKLIQQIQQTNARGDELLAEYKQRIDDMSKVITDQREATAEAVDLRKKVDELHRIRQTQAQQLDTAQEAASASQKRHDSAIRQLSEHHADELERAAGRAEIAHEKALAAAERKHAAEIRSLYEEMDKIRQQLGAAQVAAVVAAQPKQPKKSELTKLAERTEDPK